MATEILVNDGGAPARIMPFVTDEAITAGDAVQLIHVMFSLLHMLKLVVWSFVAPP